MAEQLALRLPRTPLSRRELEGGSPVALFYYARRQGWPVPPELARPTQSAIVAESSTWRPAALRHLLGEWP